MVLGVVEVLVSDEELDGLAQRVELLRQGVGNVPFAPVTILDAAAQRLDAGALELVAGDEQFVPCFGRCLGIEAGLFEQRFVVAELGNL